MGPPIRFGQALRWFEPPPSGRRFAYIRQPGLFPTCKTSAGSLVC